jgi:hypothetical protein
MNRSVLAASSIRRRIIARESCNGSGRVTISRSIDANTKWSRISSCMKRKRTIISTHFKIELVLLTLLILFLHKLNSKS